MERYFKCENVFVKRRFSLFERIMQLPSLKMLMCVTKGMAVIQHVQIYVSVPWACGCWYSIKCFEWCVTLSPALHLQSGHPTKQKAESTVESPGWAQRWCVTFDNLWKIKTDGCQLYLIFLFFFMLGWVFSFNSHPLGRTHGRQPCYCSLANQGNCC